MKVTRVTWWFPEPTEPQVNDPVHGRSPGLPLRIVSVGRLNWVKGFEYAAKPSRCFASAGFGSPTRSSGQIRGLRSRCASSYVTSACRTSQPSLSDDAPVAAMGAMAVGLPVVATDVGGTAQIVAGGAHGYVVSPPIQPHRRRRPAAATGYGAAASR
jgi:hypothetical protein